MQEENVIRFFSIRPFPIEYRVHSLSRWQCDVVQLVNMIHSILTFDFIFVAAYKYFSTEYFWHLQPFITVTLFISITSTMENPNQIAMFYVQT